MAVMGWPGSWPGEQPRRRARFVGLVVEVTHDERTEWLGKGDCLAGKSHVASAGSDRDGVAGQAADAADGLGVEQDQEAGYPVAGLDGVVGERLVDLHRMQ